MADIVDRIADRRLANVNESALPLLRRSGDPCVAPKPRRNTPPMSRGVRMPEIILTVK